MIYAGEDVHPQRLPPGEYPSTLAGFAFTNRELVGASIPKLIGELLGFQGARVELDISHEVQKQEPDARFLVYVRTRKAEQNVCRTLHDYPSLKLDPHDIVLKRL